MWQIGCVPKTKTKIFSFETSLLCIVVELHTALLCSVAKILIKKNIDQKYFIEKFEIFSKKCMSLLKQDCKGFKLQGYSNPISV